MRVSIFEERDSLGSENLTANEFADTSLEVISDKLSSSSHCDLDSNKKRDADTSLEVFSFTLIKQAGVFIKVMSQSSLAEEQIRKVTEGSFEDCESHCC